MRRASEDPMKALFLAAGLAALATALGAPYSPPRTPWGDPDLQGNYTNKYEANTPLERPAEFAGRRPGDVSEAELAAIRARRQQQVVERPAAVGPTEFRDPLEVTRASRAWFLVDPPDGRVPTRTAAAQQRIASYGTSYEASLDTTIAGVFNGREFTGSSFGEGPFDGPEDFGLWDRCITRGVPGSMLPHVLGNSYQIVQGPGVVAIRYELIHDTRLIPLDGRPHVSRNLGLDLGDARGHWEHDTLVVETTRFRDRSTFRNANAATLRLIERFTRTSPSQVEWSVTVDDPATWTRPWTFSIPLTMNDQEAILEFACHEGNYAVPHILSAARAGEAGRVDGGTVAGVQSK
jgi:hypothetical protein